MAANEGDPGPVDSCSKRADDGIGRREANECSD